MGNIYFEQKKYPQAVKQYRMALDQVPNTHKDMRSAFLRKLSPLIKPLFQIMFGQLVMKKKWSYNFTGLVLYSLNSPEFYC